MLKDIATLYITLCLLMVKTFQNSPTILSIMLQKPLLSTNTLSAVKLIAGLLNEEASLRKEEQSSLTFDLRQVVSSVVCMAINSSVCLHFCCDDNCGIQLKRWQVISLVTNNLLFFRFSPARNSRNLRPHCSSPTTLTYRYRMHVLIMPSTIYFSQLSLSYAQRYASCPYYAQLCIMCKQYSYNNI